MDGSFIERLAGKMGIAALAVNIFGQAVEREGITVIPVAKVRYGFGVDLGKEMSRKAPPEEEECTTCGYSGYSYNSCRDRHCPTPYRQRRICYLCSDKVILTENTTCSGILSQ